MYNKSQIVVDLPILHASVTLPRHLAEVIELVIEADFMGINTIQLYKAGFVSPAKAIYKLRKAGALIETQLEDTCYAGGKRHKRVANYIYRGWQCDAYQPNFELMGAESI